jgi:hypothetical protein
MSLVSLKRMQMRSVHQRRPIKGTEARPASRREAERAMRHADEGRGVARISRD